MFKYKDEDIEKARNLRKKYHYSFAAIQKLTGIPATTIRNWCKDDFLGTKWDTLLCTNERKRKEIKQSEISIISQKEEITPKDAKLLLSLLYWCEGSKYPISNCLTFVNSEPTLMKFFIILLRKAFQVDELKFRVHLQLHNNQNFDKIVNFWSILLNIPSNQFIKPTITIPRGGKHRETYNGTCTLKYFDYRIQLKLIGLYEAFANKLLTLHENYIADSSQ